MLPSLKLYAGVAGMSAILFLAGCQTSGQPAPRSALVTTPQGLLTCRNCKVSIIQDPVTDPQGRLIGYRSRTVMECPDCTDEVTGGGEDPIVTRHICRTCGESIAICSMHKPSTRP